jgi:hypothetical protein
LAALLAPVRSVEVYFQTTLTEKEGEYVHSHVYLIIADDTDEATQKANKFAADWYNGEGVERGEYHGDDDCWHFFGGEIIVTVSEPTETTLEEFITHIKPFYVID